MPNCYYYDEQRNRCNCYVNENLNELLDENAKLQDENVRLRSCLSDDAENARMIMAENAKLRELVRCLVYATHPLDRAMLIANAAEMGIEVD